jgi:isoleucyl-tRNA synthetase
MRKANGFEVTDRINIRISCSHSFIREALNNNLSYICAEILADNVLFDEELKDGELARIDEYEILIAISKI